MGRIKVSPDRAPTPFFVRFKVPIAVVLGLAAAARAYVYFDLKKMTPARSEPSAEVLKQMVEGADRKAAAYHARRNPQGLNGGAGAITVAPGALSGAPGSPTAASPAANSGVPLAPGVGTPPPGPAAPNANLAAGEPRARGLWLNLNSGATIRLEPRDTVTGPALAELGKSLRGACVRESATVETSAGRAKVPPVPAPATAPAKDGACGHVLAIGNALWTMIGACPPPAPASTAKPASPPTPTRIPAPPRLRVITGPAPALATVVSAEGAPADAVADVREIIFGGGACRAPAAAPVIVNEAYALTRETR